MAWLQSSLVLILMVVYGLLGAFLFQYSERPITRAQQAQMAEWTRVKQESTSLKHSVSRQNLLYVIENHIFANRSLRTDKQRLEQIENEINQLDIRPRLDLNENLNTTDGHDGEGGEGDSPSVDWNLWEAMYYVFCLCTPVGYGDLHVVGGASKCLTVVYSLFGLLLFIALLGELGVVLFELSSFVWRQIQWVLWKCKSIKTETRTVSLADDKEAAIQVRHEEQPQNLDDAQAPIWMAALAVTVWMGGCAALFSWHEHWSYTDALYFIYVSTFTTIGLGELKPADRFFSVVTIPLIIIQLSLVSMALNMIAASLDQSYDRLVQSLEKSYKARVLALPAVDPNQPADVQAFVRNLPWMDKLAVKLMSEHKLQLLNDRYEQLASMACSSTQTDWVTSERSLQVTEHDKEFIIEVDHDEEEQTNEEQHAQQVDKTKKKKRRMKREQSTSSTKTHDTADTKVTETTTSSHQKEQHKTKKKEAIPKAAEQIIREMWHI